MGASNIEANKQFQGNSSTSIYKFIDNTVRKLLFALYYQYAFSKFSWTHNTYLYQDI